MTEPGEFWAQVSTAPGCWHWLGGQDGKGYGRTMWHGRRMLAHRIAYQLVHGPIPADLLVCHTCDVRDCVNPAHLWLGTQRDNQDDCTEKGRRPKGARVEPKSRARGERARAKLTAAQVEAIRVGYQRGRPGEQRRLAQAFGISQTQVSRIVRAESWRIQ